MKKIKCIIDEVARYAPMEIKRMKNPIFKLLILLWVFPFILIKNRWLSKKGLLHLSYFEVVVTTRCTLKCKNCANLMQYYKNPKHVPWEVIENSVQRLLESIDRVDSVGILGGEPFLYPELSRVVELLESSPKVRAIRVITNGTLIPKNEEVLKALTAKKVVVQLNSYSNVHMRVVNELVQLFDSRKIKYKLMKMNGTEWLDYGDLNCRDRSEKELEQQFERCRMDCRSLYNGKLFYCPRSGHGMDLGFLSENSEDYVDFMDKSLSIQELRERLCKLLFGGKYVEACNHCDKGTTLCKPIPAAVQMERVSNNVKSNS